MSDITEQLNDLIFSGDDFTLDDLQEIVGDGDLAAYL
jgi:hypothetical protein